MIRYLTELSLEHFTEAARNVPYQRIQSELFPGIDLWIRRDDLIDPLISGNKAYKLIYNLIEARAQGKDTIVTCGGAWSNHIHATAAAGQRFGFKTVGIIRGHRPPVLSAMLQDAERFGMELKFVSRVVYRQRHEPDFCSMVGVNASGAWFIPEGGANQQGAEGVRLLGKIIGETCPVAFDECWLACGTGLTLGALASSLPAAVNPVGVPVLKAEKSIVSAISKWARASKDTPVPKLITDCHHGGYGRYTDKLLGFLYQVSSAANLGLDHVYMGKVANALVSEYGGCTNNEHRSKGEVGRQSRILMLHTGGLQGIRGLPK